MSEQDEVQVAPMQTVRLVRQGGGNAAGEFLCKQLSFNQTVTYSKTYHINWARYA